MSKRRAARRAGTVASLAILLSACAHAGSTGSPTTTQAPAPHTTQSASRAAIISGWLAAENAYTTALGEPGGWKSPLLPATMVEPHLDDMRRAILLQEQEGFISRGTPDYTSPPPRISAATPTTATVIGCDTGDDILVNAKTGAPAPGPAGEANLVAKITSTMVLDGGVWKVKGQTTESGTCTGV